MRILLSVICCVCILSSASPGRSVIDKTVRESFDVEEGVALQVKHGDGDVTITPWERDVIDIEVVYRATFTSLRSVDQEDFTVEFEQRGDRISVVGKEPRMVGIGAKRVEEYTYTIKAPDYTLLTLDGVDGDVVIEDWRNSVKVTSIDGDIEIIDVNAAEVLTKTVDGSIDLKQIVADVDAQTVDGNINLESMEGSMCRLKAIDGDIEVREGSADFTAGTVDGDIEMRGILASEIDLHSSDGDIRLELEMRDIEGRIKTSDGSVRLRLAEGLQVSFEVRTGDGRIQTDLSPVSDLEMSDHYFSGSINGGGGMLKIQTGDGDVDILE